MPVTTTVARDFLSIAVGSRDWPSVRGDLDKFLARLISRLDAQEGRAGGVPQFYNAIDMQSNAITHGPDQSKNPPAAQDFITRAFADSTYATTASASTPRTVATAIKTIVFSDSPYALTANDELVLADCTGGSIIVRLPAIKEVQRGRQVTVKKLGGSNSVTVKGDVNIDGAASLVITQQFRSYTMIADGAAHWWIR